MRHPGARRPRDDVAGTDLDRFTLRLTLEDGERRRPQLERGPALEEDEKLLVGRVAVRRRAVLPGLEPSEVHAGVLRPGLASEQHPAAPLPLVRGLGVADVDRPRLLRRAGVGTAAAPRALRRAAPSAPRRRR